MTKIAEQPEPMTRSRAAPEGGILFMIHCRSNTGFAIGRLERTFHEAALRCGYAPTDIHFSYSSLAGGKPSWMNDSMENFLEYDFWSDEASATSRFEDFLRRNKIRSVLGFDLQPHNPVNAVLRRAGVRRVVAYWGAPISSENRGLRLLLKRVEMAVRRNAPDRYVFESRSMFRMGTHGRGLPAQRCVLVPLGVDVDRFRPDNGDSRVFAELGIPSERKVFVYSGHMEERKGVGVIVRAMDLLVARGREDIHFLALGDSDGHRERLLGLLKSPDAEEFITFGGYRNNIEELFRSAYAGLIATTGWDSGPLSMVEMAASGLPLIVSDLHGPGDFVRHDADGWKFPPGEVTALAGYMERLADSPDTAARFGRRNREKVLATYSWKNQVERLAEILRDERRHA